MDSGCSTNDTFALNSKVALTCFSQLDHFESEAQKAQQSQTSRDVTRGRSPKRRGLGARGIREKLSPHQPQPISPSTSPRFKNIPPGNNFLVHCERIVASSRCCKQRSGARKTWSTSEVLKLETRHKGSCQST